MSPSVLNPQNISDTSRNMERGLLMLLHGLVIGLISYAVMVFGLGQKSYLAENRSVLIAAMVTIYMVLFGHGLPTALRHNL